MTSGITSSIDSPASIRSFVPRGITITTSPEFGALVEVVAGELTVVPGFGTAIKTVSEVELLVVVELVVVSTIEVLVEGGDESPIFFPDDLLLSIFSLVGVVPAIVLVDTLANDVEPIGSVGTRVLAEVDSDAVNDPTPSINEVPCDSVPVFALDAQPWETTITAKPHAILTTQLDLYFIRYLLQVG